jgi:4'-phosphopantetheinyl transferase EntD
MKNIFFSQEPKISGFKSKYPKKNELIGFVADQFKKLAKKNIKIPVQLYHL